MSKTFRTAWLSDVVDIIDDPETNRIVCHGKEFALVKHGHWVREEDEFGNYWSCSHCNQFNYSGKSRYCPHCGTKMDEIVIENVKTYET